MAFFIRADNGSGDIFEMDATVSVSYNSSGKPTQYTMESNSKSSDHYEHNQDTITFSGYVSKVKFLRRSEGSVSVSLEDFEKGIKVLKNSGKFFSCSFSSNSDIKKNCLFTSLTISQDDTTGKDAIKVDFNITQVLVASQSELVEVPIPAEAFKDIVEDNKKSGNSTTEASGEEETKIEDTIRELSPSYATAVFGE